jgi:TolA-binding protein
MNAQKSPRSTRLFIPAALVAAAFTAANIPALLAQAPPAAPAITAGDARDFEAADELFRQNKFKEAADAFEKFQAKYKGLSPRSLDAKFRLAVSYVQQGLYDDAIRHLRELIANQKVDVAAREMAQLLVAKSITLKGFKMPSETDAQKAQQKKVFTDAIKEYDQFLATFPKSADVDSAQFW